MKINAKTLKAVKAIKPAVKAAKVTKSKKGAKKSAAVVLGKVTSRQIAVALLSGERGFAARLVEHLKYATGQESIRALHSNKGIPMKDGHVAILDGGKLTSKAPKEARIELGGYVNGRNTNARVEILTEAQFAKRAGNCIVHWDTDDNGVRGQYIGNPAETGMSAILVKYGKFNYYWHMEQDSNPNNKHERGDLKPLTAGGKLADVK